MTENSGRERPDDLFAVYSEQLPEAMDEKMRVGRQRHGDSWLDIEPQYAFRRMEEEFYEFRQAVEHDRDEMGAIEELADMVNFGLMFLAHERSRDTGSSQNDSLSEGGGDE